MTMTTQQIGSTLHITLTGSLGFAERDEFRQVVRRLEAFDGQVEMDLDGLDTIDSAGMGLLLVALDEVRAAGGKAVIRNARGVVERKLALARFDRLFTQE